MTRPDCAVGGGVVVLVAAGKLVFQLLNDGFCAFNHGFRGRRSGGCWSGAWVAAAVLLISLSPAGGWLGNTRAKDDAAQLLHAAYVDRRIDLAPFEIYA